MLLFHELLCVLVEYLACNTPTHLLFFHIKALALWLGGWSFTLDFCQSEHFLTREGYWLTASSLIDRCSR